jgi:hypothetical protein
MVDFGAFLEVFYNHRPGAGRGGVTLAQVQEAFAVLQEMHAGGAAGEGAWGLYVCYTWSLHVCLWAIWHMHCSWAT